MCCESRREKGEEEVDRTLIAEELSAPSSKQSARASVPLDMANALSAPTDVVRSAL